MSNEFISVEQDKPKSLELLAAMRYFYSKSKAIRLFRISITTLLPIISILSLNFFPSFKLPLAFFSALWILFNQFLFQKIETKRVKNGAKLQEAFDVKLFKLEWNDILVGDKTSTEDIISSSQKFSGDRKKLLSWYQGLESEDHFSNVLSAQYENLAWGIKLRRFYSIILLTVFIIYLLILFTVSFFYDYSVQTLLLSFMIPSQPLLLHLYSTYNAHEKWCKESETITFKIINQMNDSSSATEESIMNKCRRYQDYIFLSRCDSNTVPDKIYWFKQNTYDKLMKKVNEFHSNSD